ncbi:UDP-N-acetylmuramate--L-alanine ligase [Candidatus Levibacter sp. Uisw_134_01]|uniref:UDP-N-acetylmuramate--L-alanine ligase n=1 Tax=Candidatus Levibacter sp. Uisw_134_01 TaxID=3230999 RepID=UPI003D49D511
MLKRPENLGVIHFIGIGGIGMSGIAEVLVQSGYLVQGSDIKASNNTKRLEKLGIEVFIGQRKSNILNAKIIVVSTAISKNNIELEEAKKIFLPIVHRAEMLGELMRLKQSIAIAGTHGKTTTTSLIAKMIEENGMDPTIINGGIISSLDSNARMGKGDWMVVEADESDGSFTKLNPTAAVITNIDLEHLDFHKNEKNLELAFFNFLSSIPFYGFICLCTDHPRVQKLISKLEDKKVITYGLSANADVRATNIIYNNNKMNFTLSISNRRKLEISSYEIEFSMIGIHNIQNALATIATGIELKIPIEKIKNTLKTFTGVQRRFQNVGNFKNTTIIDDYGHHPVEINAALAAARLLTPKSKIISVFQPHRYSRIKDLFNDFCSCFNDADYVFLLDVYPAGEEPLKGFESNDLKNGLLKYGHKNVLYIESKKALIKETLKIISPHDIIICLGAGSITKIANTLEKELHNGS